MQNCFPINESIVNIYHFLESTLIYNSTGLEQIVHNNTFISVAFIYYFNFVSFSYIFIVLNLKKVKHDKCKQNHEILINGWKM